MGISAKELIVKECLGVLKRDDVKQHIQELFHPIIDMLMVEIWPYIFISMIFVVVSFLIILGNFVLLLRAPVPLSVPLSVPGPTATFLSPVLKHD